MKIKKIIITILFIALFGFCIISLIRNSQAEPPKEWSGYTVKSGDTVCKIAQNITPNTEDYRETQYFIIKKNNIKDALILPGQTILIPIKKETEPELKNIGKFKVTAYCSCVKCCGKTDGITASGVKAVEGVTIATDKSIPFGTEVYIEGVGERIVQDRGGAITQGKIDLFFNSHSSALEFGVQYKDVYIKGENM